MRLETEFLSIFGLSGIAFFFFMKQRNMFLRFRLFQNSADFM